MTAVLLSMSGPGILLSYGAGWQQEGENWQYYNEENRLLVSELTPDGYYVDENGNWRKNSTQALGMDIAVPDRYCTPEEMGDWSRILVELNQVKDKVYEDMGEMRSFHVYEDAVVYCRVSGDTETELISLSKNEAEQGYRLALAVNLGTRSGRRSLASTCDYGVFRFLLAKISHYPEQAVDAIYESWQGKNSWNVNREQDVSVMDLRIRCDVENGKGIYQIRPLLP